MTAIILAAFFLSPLRGEGPRPLELTGDMRADWTNHAFTAEACAVERLPTVNILKSWRKLGVKMYKRVPYDPEGSAEHFRRTAGFMAVREDADGVWLPDEGKFPDTWKQALEEAKADVAAALYCRALAEKALGWKAKDHKVWIEGRRVMWLFDWMDFDSENLDTMRLEFICYARRLEQLLGEKPRKLPLNVAKPIEPDRQKFTPLEGRDVQCAPVAVDMKAPVRLAEGLSFSCDSRGFRFTIASKEGDVAQGWPGGKASLRLYIPDGRGGYMPYEFRLDLSPVAGDRAPTEGHGCWFLKERWGKGAFSLYGDPTTWRMQAFPHGSYGSRYPRLEPSFSFRWNDKGRPGWTVSLGFSWLSVYGYWPALRNGVAEKWYVSLDALPGVPAAACRMDWAKGREINFRHMASGISCDEITSRYDAQVAQASGIYRLWHEERLYGFAKTETPTYQRFDAESDKVFWRRVVEPMMDANASIADMTRVSKDKDNNTIPAKLGKQDDAVKLAVWKGLGKLFDLAERVSAARRDYILLRLDGRMPPEPPLKRKPEGAAAIAAPDVDNDDEAIQLDDKEF